MRELRRNANLVVVEQCEPTNIESPMMKTAQRDSVKEIVSAERTVRNNVCGLDLPTQRIGRIHFQSTHSAAKVVNFNDGLAKPTNSQRSFSYSSDDFAASVEWLVIFWSASSKKLLHNFLNFVGLDRQ